QPRSPVRTRLLRDVEQAHRHVGDRSELRTEDHDDLPVDVGVRARVAHVRGDRTGATRSLTFAPPRPAWRASVRLEVFAAHEPSTATRSAAKRSACARWGKCPLGDQSSMRSWGTRARSRASRSAGSGAPTTSTYGV